MYNSLLLNVPEAINKILDNYKIIVVPKDSQPVPLKHGRWITDDTGAEYCSNCHEYPYDDGEYYIANWHSNYCPNCGARMDEVKDNEL